MKLEEPKDTEEEDIVFCSSCGQQLFSIDEIAQRICHKCKKEKQQEGEEGGSTSFFCWACGKPLKEMSEIAQGVCNHCKASIIRKLDTHENKTMPV